MARGSLLALVLTLSVAPAATAQTSPLLGPQVLRPAATGNSQATLEAQRFRELRVPGRKVQKAVRKLRRLHWYKKLKNAARDAETQNKPILWIQALGDLKGYV